MPALAPDEGRQLAYALRVAQVLGVSSTAFFCGTVAPNALTHGYIGNSLC